MFEEQLNPSLNCVETMSPKNDTNGVECETDGREDKTLIQDESVLITNASNSVIQIDDSGYDEVVVEVVETEPTDDKTAVENAGPSNANPNEIESKTISTQNTSHTRNSNDG